MDDSLTPGEGTHQAPYSTLRARAVDALRIQREATALYQAERLRDAGKMLRRMLRDRYGVVLESDPDGDSVEVEGLVFRLPLHSGGYGAVELIRPCSLCGGPALPAKLQWELPELGRLIGAKAWCAEHDPQRRATPAPSAGDRLLDAFRDYVAEIVAEEVAACR